jgi:MFS superfamily sulfate permease-like transporter
VTQIITGFVGIIVGIVISSIFFAVKYRKLNKACDKREMEIRTNAERRILQTYEDGWNDGNSVRC